MKKWMIFTFLFAMTGSAFAAEKTVKNFTLRDYRGKQHSLGDYSKSKLVVLAVLGTDCPLVKLYAPRLERLSKKYADQGVTFLGINSNEQDTVTKVAAFARIHRITFPVLKDPDNAVADLLKAERSPEVFVLDAKRQIRYRGRIDDQFGVGFQRSKPTRDDLAIAIDELLAGKKVSIAKTKATGCIIGRSPKVKPTGEVTYSNQISRILQNNCVSCHRKGDIAPFPLTTYKEVRGWAGMINEVVQEKRMPPWNANPKHGKFKNEAILTKEEKKLIETWVENGRPEGDRKDLPKPKKFTEGWQIPKPDVVFAMSKKPYKVPAEGVVKYQYFSVPTNFKEDKWIQAAEAIPGNRSVVHHIIVFVRPPKSAGFRSAGGIGFAPGLPPPIYPKGTAMYVPAGSRLVFQVHYTPNGSPQQDISKVGFVFANPKSVKKIIGGGMAANRGFRIPPGADNHKVVSSYTFWRETKMLSLSPHMHLRGKSFRFEAHYPNGKKEILLDVPKYDFNWQLRYVLAKPKVMPKGTKLICTAHFDNSEFNLNNPDPKKTVRWGDQTWEEMMIGWFTTQHDRK